MEQQDPDRSRRRNSLLAAIEVFRDIDPGMTLNNLVVFLYAAENQGLNVSELAAVTNLYKATASRCARALVAPGAPGALPPYLGLIEVRRGGPAKNSKTLTLTRAGLELCEILDRHIGDPVLIDPVSGTSAPQRVQASIASSKSHSAESSDTLGASVCG
ncbi:hypothetical protein N0B44_21175 [Roseibacterium beibuensis]|uniref:hypothetical protein n=1 Tax=[Roseibacterium] beibuensis TaxID=1193142 RepID=UPI00217E68AC|nr:hypothetical protein [Roseibacterium beibuensis]MCS6625428.1 hypothetical protein [Roseibacterium beibuensis]